MSTETFFYMVAWDSLLWSLPSLNKGGMNWVHLWPDAMHFATEEQAAAIASSIVPDIDTKARVVRMATPSGGKER